MDQWLENSATLVPGPGLEAQCAAVDQFLALRTFMVGYSLTIADLAVWGQLQGEP